MHALCDQTRGRLIGGEPLSTENERHIAGCAPCRGVRELLRATEAALTPAEPPAHVDERVRFYARACRDRDPAVAPLVVMRRRWLAAAAAVALIVAVQFFHHPTTGPASSSPALPRQLVQAPATAAADDLDEIFRDLDDAALAELSAATDAPSTAALGWQTDEIDVGLTQLEMEMQFYRFATDDNDGNQVL